jgi:glycosyltransferase involved in cell wall biosynthesis
MKVLYIGHYREGHSGWATAAQHFIRALDTVGVDVVPRSIKLNATPGNVHPRVLELEKKPARGADIVIQNILPHVMEKVGGVPNVGLSYFESSTLNMSVWPNRLRLMDHHFVTSEQGWRLLRDEGCNVAKIASPSDVSEFDKDYEPFDIPELKDKFVFYFIGEFTKRKNIAAIIRAFNTAFRTSENVALVLKIGKHGKNPQELQQEAANFIDHVKRGMKLPRYHKEMLITDTLGREQILRLHATCHCLVAPSHGEGWLYPAYDAVASTGNPVLTTADDNDFFSSLESTEDQCFGEGDNFPFLFTAMDSWKVPNVNSLAEEMRWIARRYTKRWPQNFRNRRKTEIRKLISYEAVGKEMKECLEMLLSRPSPV